MNFTDLQPFGWHPFFQQQLSLDEWELCSPARIVDYQRTVFTCVNDKGKQTLSISSSMPGMTVGDWILLDETDVFSRLLERSSVFVRKSAGSKVDTQLVAANIDTVFIVCSMNQDFSLNRIERYLALAHEAGVEPVIVLSKADLADNAQYYLDQVATLGQQLAVVAVNGLHTTSVVSLLPWCTSGKTVALLGSSGVGKSTLVNTLLGDSSQLTAEIRADDDEGRHTTTSRSLHSLSGGGSLLDTPGMRELQLVDCEQGIEAAFSDVTELAQRCKFTDCQHLSESDCAVKHAIELGDLDARRLNSYRKLQREQLLNSATQAEKHRRDRQFGKMVRNAMAHKADRR